MYIVDVILLIILCFSLYSPCLFYSPSVLFLFLFSFYLFIYLLVAQAHNVHCYIIVMENGNKSPSTRHLFQPL